MGKFGSCIGALNTAAMQRYNTITNLVFIFALVLHCVVDFLWFSSVALYFREPRVYLTVSKSKALVVSMSHVTVANSTSITKHRMSTPISLRQIKNLNVKYYFGGKLWQLVFSNFFFRGPRKSGSDRLSAGEEVSVCMCVRCCVIIQAVTATYSSSPDLTAGIAFFFGVHCFQKL